MIQPDSVLEVLYTAVEALNASLPADRRLPFSPETTLLGSERLDSLGLTNLLIAAEQAAEREMGATVDLLGDAIMSTEPSPLATLASLAEYISKQIDSSVAP